MPSRSTNLLAKRPLGRPPVAAAGKRKRDAPASAPAAAAPVAPVTKGYDVVAGQEEEEEAKGAAAASTEEQPAKKKAKGKEGVAVVQKENGDETDKAAAPVKAVGEPLPTKEAVEADASLNEGCKLAILYALLYLRFNPVPLIPAPAPTKSMKAAHPLPLDPYASASSASGGGGGALFASDWTPPNAQFELTSAQYAARKKNARDGRAKKGDGKGGERWTFNKAREGWLIRWCCDQAQLPSPYFPVALAYLTSVKAPAAREVLSAQARGALASEGPENEEKRRRAKAVLLRCFGEGEEEEQAADASEAAATAEGDEEADSSEGNESGDDEDEDDED